MNWLINRLAKMRLFQEDVDYHLVRSSMVIIYFFFGYQKWFDYEAQGLIPIFYARAFDFLDVSCLRNERIHLSSRCIRVAVWSPIAGWVLEQEAWNLGCARIGGRISLHRHDHPVHAGWLASSAGGFPAMVGNVAFLMKDLVLLAVSFYLLKQDLVRATQTRNVVAEQEAVLR